MTEVTKYIRANWENAIHQPNNVTRGIIRMPVPFSVPCADGCFSDFYYWDTYFADLGLLLDGHIQQVYNNLDVMAYFIRYLGYVPNSNHIIDRSQPPLFARGVYDLYRYTGDKEVIGRYIGAILDEYLFFRYDRMTPCGLNAYSTYTPRAMLLRHYPWLSERVGIFCATEEEKIGLCKQLLSIAESGWDFNPRFRTEKAPFAVEEFAHLDLNCLLYDMERKTAAMLEAVGRKESDEFYRYAEQRAEKMRRCMRDANTGIYYDYNFKSNSFSSVLSCASFYPYAVGLEKESGPLLTILERLELPYGLAACEYRGEQEKYYQWDYPSMWPTNVYFAYEALMAVGEREAAERIAAKYRRTVEAVFEQTGSLWEKYDAKKGDVSCTSEYETPRMMGWTAGVYRYLEEQSARR